MNASFFMRDYILKVLIETLSKKSCDVSKFVVEQLERRRQHIVFCLIRTSEALVCETDFEFLSLRTRRANATSQKGVLLSRLISARNVNLVY
jgi:hypothetical protein